MDFDRGGVGGGGGGIDALRRKHLQMEDEDEGGF